MTEYDGSLIDSNILVYAYDVDEGEKNKTCKKIMKNIVNGNLTVFLSTQNLAEFFVNVSKKISKPLAPLEAKAILTELTSLSNVKIRKIGELTILRAIDLVAKFGISFWDALIVSVMKENEVDVIISENGKDFKKIPGLKVINPFSRE